MRCRGELPSWHWRVDGVDRLATARAPHRMRWLRRDAWRWQQRQLRGELVPRAKAATWLARPAHDERREALGPVPEVLEACRSGANVTSLEQQLQASVDLLRYVVPRDKLPTEAELTAVHAQLARVIRERVKVWRSV